MMPVLKEAMLTAGSSPALSILLKATLITALALTGARLGRRSRAAVRHALFAATFGVLLLLPVVSLVAPAYRIGLREPVTPVTTSRVIAAPVVFGRVTPPGVQQAGVSVSTLIWRGWIAGATIFLLPVLLGLYQVRALRRAALPWRRGQAVLDALAQETGTRRRADVLLHESLTGPMTCGVLRPAIVLPADAERWREADLERALVHEMEHIRRSDWLANCLSRSVCAAYWFHPLVWIAWRKMLVEAERSADDAVLEKSEATAYADQLVGLAQRLSTAARSPFLAMANRADLSARVAAVLDGGQQRGRAGAYSVSILCVASMLLLLSLAPLRLVAAPQDTNVIVTGARLQTRSALVLEMVQVFDSAGRTVEDLSAADFAITEDGVPQAIRVFELQKVTAAQAGLSSPTSYYLLGYYTGPSPVDYQLRQVAITVKDRPNVRLEYRPSYYANSSSGSAFGGVPDRERVTNADTSLRPPVLIFKREPEYSEEARKAKYQGTVVLKVDVGTDGRATHLEAIRSLGLGLDEKAIEAVAQWRFRPATKDGQPVAVQLQVAVDFRLM